jgi:nicotinamidase-related amidase
VSAALLVMDFQLAVLGRYPPTQVDELLTRTQHALSGARAAGVPIIFVRLACSADDPQISTRNRLFSPLAGLPEFAEGDSGTSIHPLVGPQPGDFVVVKKRASAFSSSELMPLIESLDITHLVLSGLATGGVVLSTVRDAADRDLDLTVLSDACADRDDEVHRVLCQKVFPMQAAVTTVADWVAALRPSPAEG